ncbi:hypothetical protein COMA1_10377 [Candidatus Nitrospira nitrosa]|uniref:HDOD domain-containing protein n=1 Tax=Candidatus Nitrospira nitrosa TaxID=1742972 RepID=A0A0S4LA94_9BACT|nr:hypothetical protein COMA1_10377 [Candidatus Nitrospira nitrosa]
MIANNPLYGFLKQIDTIVHAVKLFGTQTVCNLVTSTTLGQTIVGVPAQLIDVPLY